MLLKFHQQEVNNFVIPDFTLDVGEIVIIQLPNGPLALPVELKVADMITGVTPNNSVEVFSIFKYAEHFKEGWFRRNFLPTTVQSYLERFANKINPISQKIYEVDWIKPNTKIQDLGGTPRRLLAIYTCMSWSNNILFDLAGISPHNGVKIYNFIKSMVQLGGSAILFDTYDEFKDDCTRFVQAKYVGPELPTTISPIIPHFQSPPP